MQFEVTFRLKSPYNKLQGRETTEQSEGHRKARDASEPRDRRLQPVAFKRLDVEMGDRTNSLLADMKFQRAPEVPLRAPGSQA